jgi:hypothetical protein
MSRILQVKKVDALINSCTEALNKSQRHIGNSVGWHQHLLSKKVGIVANSIAILYYNLLNKDCPEAGKSREFIINAQQEDYGWPYISNLPDTSNVESTCWALKALYLNKEENVTNIDNGVKWLLGKTEIDSPIDQGWGFVSSKFSRVYHTCLVLRTLKILEKTDKVEYESGLHFIINLQNSDGGWGETQGKPSGIFYTSYAIVTLIQCGYSSSEGFIIKAIKWLESNISKEGLEAPSNVCCLEFIEESNEGKKSRTPFFHFTIPHIIQAFVLSGNQKNTIVFDGLKYLLSTNEEGFWKHPFLEDSSIKPIWAIYDSIEAISVFKNSHSNWEKIHHFKLWQKKIRVICNFNPIRLWDLLNPKIGRFISISIVLSIIIYSVITIYQFIPTEYFQEAKEIKEFSLSIMSSLIASLMIVLIKPIYGIWFNGRRNNNR